MIPRPWSGASGLAGEGLHFPTLLPAGEHAVQWCQNSANKIMIGIGIPSSQSRMPLPKPMSLLLFFSAMVETVNSRKNNSYWRFQFHHEYPKSTANIEVGQLFTISSSGLESGLVN